MKLNYFEGLCSFFIVGLGQIIKGESKKGVALLLLFYFCLPALIYTSLLVASRYFLYVLGFAIISAIMLWLYSCTEALFKS